jgi:ADP-ribose pyrophosphatase
VTDLEDVLRPRPVLASEQAYSGMLWDVVRDTVDLGTAGRVRREYVRHPGAVGVLALDETERVLLLRQYRHPVGYELWELPAGLLDVDGEPALDAARRELAEETDLAARRWDVLIDWFNSPGGMDEAIRVYLARDLQDVPHADRFEREHEEADMPMAWVPLEEARDAVLTGRLHNPTAVVGVLAACAARERGWSTLRPADAPWPQHKAFR